MALVSTALLAFSSALSTPLAYALPNDPQKDSPFADFDIRSFGFSGNDQYVQVYGFAGRTLATGDEQIFAYVFYTDDGIWAANNHGFGHGDPEGDAGHVWHSERVIFDDPDNPKCLVGADNESEQRIAGKRVTLLNTAATEIFKAQTMELEHVADEPNNPDCPGAIARVVKALDTAQ